MKEKEKSTLLNKVKNIREIEVTDGDIENLKAKVIENNDVNSELKDLTKQIVAQSIKNSIANQHSKFYKAFENMDYDQLMGQVTNMKQITEGKDKLSAMTLAIPESFLATLPQGEIGTYPTSFQISPNSFWNNITNILNKITVGDNLIDTGDSFNAWTMFQQEELSSGEAKLVTQGYSISGTCLLNQSEIVPKSTQMAKGFQCTLGCFINSPDPQDVGGGTGIGLFQLYAIPINVIKLAVTQPQQFSQIVRIFYATAVNTKLYSLWMITTDNFLTNIHNYIVDNNNTNIRNCLNGTLFPAIKIMENPTNEFNCGIPTYYNDSTTSTIDISMLRNTATMNALTSTTRRPTLQSNYLVKGSNPNPRIQTSKREDIHLIVSPKFFVALKSGILSELFHWEFQRLEEYVLPENIHMLYKQVEIEASEMNTANSQGLYPFQTSGLLGQRWLPDNAIVVFTKPADSNNWTAQYGPVWTTEMSNEWGAGMISTAYLQYAIYGGVIPWSNAFIFYAKNLLNVVSDGNPQIDYDFSLGVKNSYNS